MDKIKGAILENFVGDREKPLSPRQLFYLLEAEKQLRVYKSRMGNVDMSLFDRYLQSLKTQGRIPVNPTQLKESLKNFLSSLKISL